MVGELADQEQAQDGQGYTGDSLAVEIHYPLDGIDEIASLEGLCEQENRFSDKRYGRRELNSVSNTHW
jgi:hypothetical protein